MTKPKHKMTKANKTHLKVANIKPVIQHVVVYRSEKLTSDLMLTPSDVVNAEILQSAKDRVMELFYRYNCPSVAVVGISNYIDFREAMSHRIGEVHIYPIDLRDLYQHMLNIAHELRNCFLVICMSVPEHKPVNSNTFIKDNYPS